MTTGQQTSIVINTDVGNSRICPSRQTLHDSDPVYLTLWHVQIWCWQVWLCPMLSFQSLQIYILSHLVFLFPALKDKYMFSWPIWDPERGITGSTLVSNKRTMCTGFSFPNTQIWMSQYWNITHFMLCSKIFDESFNRNRCGDASLSQHLVVTLKQ